MNKEHCERVFTDKMSGKRFDRPEFLKMLDVARAGDVIVVWRLDRLDHVLECAAVMLHGQKSKIGEVFGACWTGECLAGNEGAQDRCAQDGQARRWLSADAHLMDPLTRKHALIGATSIQALPLSFVKPIGADSRTKSREEAISFGSLYERANVSC